jgi:hypothetical protein
MKVWVDKDGNKQMIDGDHMKKEVKVKIEENEDGTSKATVITITTENGETKTEELFFEGTMEEIKSKIKELEDVEVKVEEGKKVIKKEIEEVIEN